MSKLILSLNNNSLDEFDIHMDRMAIGRKSENDIIIDNPAISSQHAMLETIRNDIFIEDLGSTNGTYINGRLIKKQALRHGDVIGIGKHEMTFINHAQDKQNSRSTTKTFATSTSPSSLTFTRDYEREKSRMPQGTPAALDMPTGRLHVLNGPIAGKELNLTKALITLGKPGKQVAVISRRPQGYFLTHIEGSKDGKQNYPEVNGESIGPKAYTLQNNDILELAGIKMEFTLST
jgi:hypothetical protein